MAKIHEVAEAAGVSISTVSYALSGKRPVGADTRRRIEEAVRLLEYRPNAGARMLAGSRTHIFALTEPLRGDTHAPTHMAFVLATAIAARRHDYDILLLTDEEASAGMRRVASSGLVDGILVLDVAPDDERVELARRLDVPVVFIGIPNDHGDLICVDLDFEAAAALALDHLIDAGHQRIGLIGQQEIAYRNSNFPPRLRAGFAARSAERGISTEFRTTGDVRVTAEESRRAVAEMLDAGVTGLALHCPEEAHSAILAELAQRGLEIPRDVSVVSVAASFDLDTLSVPLDVIPLIPRASCDLAVDLAVRCLTEDDRPEPGIYLIDPVYDDHGTVAAPPLSLAP